MASSPYSFFLQCPVEIRLRVYNILFGNDAIVVEFERLRLERVETGLKMKVISLSAQLLRVCKQIHDEGQVQLYSKRIFDCSQREGIELLLQSIGPVNFSAIKHVKTDWDELQSFSWALAKEEFQLATEGLRCLELATWRTKMAGHSAFLWKQVQSYERQLCESALNICQKHRSLNMVAEKVYQRSGRAGVHAKDVRIKWRFIESEKDLNAGESIARIQSDLARMRLEQQDDRDREPNLIIDAF